MKTEAASFQNTTEKVETVERKLATPGRPPRPARARVCAPSGWLDSEHRFRHPRADAGHTWTIRHTLAQNASQSRRIGLGRADLRQPKV